MRNALNSSNEESLRGRGKYVNPMSDYGFKRLFGRDESKSSLISFINSIIEGINVTDIVYANPEQIRDSVDMQKVIFDVYCKTSSGEEIIVEMQKYRMTYLVDRTIFYMSTVISQQSEIYKRNYYSRPVYVIAILDFKLPWELKDDSDRYIWRYSYREDTCHVQLSNCKLPLFRTAVS